MRERPLSIVFVLANGGHGGMQSQVLTISRSLCARGHTVTIAVGGGDLEAPPGIRVAALPTLSARTAVSFVVALRRVARESRAQVVHGHGLRVAPAVRLSGVSKRYVSCHGLDPLEASRGARLAKWSRVPVVSCGQGPKDLLAQFNVASTVINNAFTPTAVRHDVNELRENFDLTANVPVVIWPARYSRQKGHDRLLDALARVRRELGHRSPEVLCFGDGPLFNDVRAAAEVPGERPLARVFQYRADAASWLSASDFFVVPSRWEGQPLVVLEALANGLSVATLSAGIEDLVVDGLNGRVAHSVEDLADIIVSWCSDPLTRPRNEALTKSILAQHTVDLVSDRYEDLYLTH